MKNKLTKEEMDLLLGGIVPELVVGSIILFPGIDPPEKTNNNDLHFCECHYVNKTLTVTNNNNTTQCLCKCIAGVY